MMMCLKMRAADDPGPCAAGLSALADIKADIAALADIKADVMILSQKIDAVHSLLTDQGAIGPVRDVMCASVDGSSAVGTSASEVFINPVCRHFVEDYQEPVHELKDILRRRKPPRGKPRWRS